MKQTAILYKEQAFILKKPETLAGFSERKISSTPTSAHYIVRKQAKSVMFHNREKGNSPY